MKIPKTIKVGGLTYKVIWGYSFTERADVTGQVEHDLLEIRIADRYKNEAIHRDRMEQVFIHELMHCVDNVYNGSAIKDDETTDRLSHGLYQILKDNKMLK